MPDTSDALQQALRENGERPYGRARTVRAEELVQAAEQLDERALLAMALLELMSAYQYSGEDRKSPVVFARIVRLWDEYPEDFGEWAAHQILWRYKWVTTSLLQVPRIPLSAVVRWTDEMRDRYRAAGQGLQPVYAMRHRIAEHTGAGVDAAYDLWTTRPRTGLSDCEACETRHRALHHVAAGADARALDMWAPVLTGRQTCLEEPHVSMAYALMPLLRCGRFDEARSYHLSGYRFARDNPDMGGSVGRHLEFCALTRNEGRGLEILAENRSLFDVTGAPLDRLDFLTGAEVVLARLAGLGHGDLAVAGPPGRSWTVDALLAALRAEASALAAAFDARNGTSAVGDRRLARLRERPLVDEPLALGIRAAVLVERPTAAETAPLKGTAEGTAVGTADRTGRGPSDAAPPTDFADLVLRARELSAIGRPDAVALWQRVRALTTRDGHVHDERTGPEAVLRAELAERHAFDLLDGEEWEAARKAMLAAAELYGQAGLPGRASSARARAVTALVAASERDPAVDCSQARAAAEAEVRLARALLDTAAFAGTGGGSGTPAKGAAAGEATVAGGGPAAGDAAVAGRAPGSSRGIENDRYLAVLQCAAAVARHGLLTGLPEPSGAARAEFDASIDRLLCEAERLDSPSRAAAARMYVAEVAARTGRFEAASEELTTALELIGAADQPWHAPRPLALLAQITMRTGHGDEALPLIRRALSTAARWPDPSLSLGVLRALLGHACAQARDVPAAVRHLSEAADRLDRDGEDEHAAQVRLELADLLAREGRQADSVAVLESVVLGPTGGFDPRLLAQVRLNLARGLTSLDEPEAAAEEYVRLADAVAQWTDEQFTHTLVAGEAAVALAEAGRWEAARGAYARAVASHAGAPRPAAVTAMMRGFARLVMAEQKAEGLASALAYLAEADAVCAGVAEAEDFPLWYQSGANHYQRGRAYASALAYQDALAEMEHAAAAYDAGGRAGEEPRAEAVRVAALIEGNVLGAVAAATARLDSAIARCEAAGLPEAAATLTAVRSGIGES